MFRHICTALLLVCIWLQDASSQTQYVISQEPSDWKTALSKCSSAGSLAVLINQSQQADFERDIRTNVGERIWVGQYVGYSPLVTIEGCYVMQSLVIERTTQLAHNSLLNCLMECPDVLYVGLQAGMCHCMNNLPATSQFVQGTMCYGGCPGEPVTPNGPRAQVSQCGMTAGNVNTVSVFRRVSQGEITMDMSRPNQGECVAFDIRAKLWKVGECSASLRFTCNTKPCPNGIQRCSIESPNPATWFDGRSQCERNNGYLSPLNETLSTALVNRASNVDMLYWTGIHRQKMNLWINDKRVNMILPSDLCIAIAKTSEGLWEWITDFCRKEYRYVCAKEIKPEIPEIPIDNAVNTNTNTNINNNIVNRIDNISNNSSPRNPSINANNANSGVVPNLEDVMAGDNSRIPANVRPGTGSGTPPTVNPFDVTVNITPNAAADLNPYTMATVVSFTAGVLINYLI